MIPPRPGAPGQRAANTGGGQDELDGHRPVLGAALRIEVWSG
ncbi:MAG: hypothetical protein QOE23_3957 [Pseudonocardiales bacterium]|jgi:hypothetical protein|nr:hypothetical protein [Pseudonocardiales bacterium]